MKINKKDLIDKIVERESLKKEVLSSMISDKKMALAGMVPEQAQEIIAKKSYVEIDNALRCDQKQDIMIRDNKIQNKTLGVTTNRNTDTDYLLSAAELNNLILFDTTNQLNMQTNTWDLLRKDDITMNGSFDFGFSIRTSTTTGLSGAYLGNAIATGQHTQLKCQTRIKKYQAGFSVDGDMVAAARGMPFGPIFTRQSRWATQDLIRDMNTDLFLEVGEESAAGIIGFAYISDSAGNTDLYNMLRSDHQDVLQSSTAGDTYINGAAATVTLANMRAAWQYMIEKGAKQEDLVWITNQVQMGLFMGIYDSAGNSPFTSMWKGRVTVHMDQTPIFIDDQTPSGKWFLIDLAHCRVGIMRAPSPVLLGKDSDSMKGYISAYWCMYYTRPNACVIEIYNNAIA